MSKMVEEVKATQCLSPKQIICVLKSILHAPENLKNLIAKRILEKILQANNDKSEMFIRYSGDILTPLLLVSFFIHSFKY